MTNEQFDNLHTMMDHYFEMERRQNQAILTALEKAIAKLDKLIDNAPSWWIEQDKDDKWADEEGPIISGNYEKPF